MGRAPLSLHYLFSFLFYCCATLGFGQQLLNNEVVLTLQKGSAVELLSHIEERSGVVFSYSNKVCLPPKVVFQSKTGTVKYFLDRIFDACQVDYQVVGNKVLITPTPVKNQRFTISGQVRDSVSGELLIGANVFDVFGSNGTPTNGQGHFSLSLGRGGVILGCSYIGFDTRFVKFNLDTDTALVFNLKPQPDLQEVPIIGLGKLTGIYSTRTGTIEIPLSQIQNVPSFMGEVDLIKSVQLFPGVQSGNEGFSGLYVRGGGADQNLILVDDISVYNVEHLLGFFSIFNPDAINKVTLIKGGFPAQYGGRLSSVLDIRTFDGNDQKHNGSVSLGLMSAKMSFNGPVKRDKTTYSLSFRRTYYDILSAPFLIQNDDHSSYYFFDLNGKLNHRFSPRSTLSVSSYWGRDELSSKYNFKSVARAIVGGDEDGENYKLNDEMGTGWGNVVTSGKWNYVINNRMFANLTGAYSNFHFFTNQSESYQSEDTWNNVTQKYFSGIRDATLKLDVDYMPINGHRAKFGASYTYHRFFPGIDVVRTELESSQRNDTTIGGRMIWGNEFRGYLQDEFSVSPQMKMNVGVHASMYSTGSRTYHSIEPRFSVRYLVAPNLSVKGAYSVMSQYLHVLNSTNVSLPSDLWLPVTDQLEPMRAWQIDAGPEWEISEGFSLSVEAYYKEIDHVLDYRENQSFFDFSQGWASKLTSGVVESYGIETLLHRKIGAVSGWLGYTWAKSISRFPDLNQGQPFRSNNDRRHDLSLFVSYRIKPSVDANITWTYGSGKPVTLSNEKYVSPNLPTALVQSVDAVERYSSKNGYNMPDFHRLDVGFNFYKDNRLGKRIWSVGVMNAYGRQNPFFLYFADSEPNSDGTVNRSLKQFSLFPIPLPYVRYTIHF